MEEKSIPEIVSINQMCSLMSISRSRYYQILDEGLINPPLYSDSKRPYFTRELALMNLAVKKNNTGVNGNYLSSEGIEGGDVWGTRARWMKLYSTMEGEKVAMVIFDHPDNVGYHTYWHARGYGLFAANPLGQEVFSKGEQVLDFKLAPNESVSFKFRLLVHSGKELRTETIHTLADQFAELQTLAFRSEGDK